jgi:hypothetical protein
MTIQLVLVVLDVEVVVVVASKVRQVSQLIFNAVHMISEVLSIISTGLIQVT